ncbi:AbrB family transcriptional regulator [Pseudomonas sp. RIT-PI-S]|uniref:AbrB family transcriptional regulator n=1 Tax=Pseudomonas sp. RIT-PI-S TaxID=3035295 RepID=UPI0021D80F14|nr:AbrB family transcriptional regulator [Pseudomonas sp. RIT-PI-S]
MKSLLCLVAAAVLGLAFQRLGIPHGLLLGAILASALIAGKLGHSPALPFGLGYVQVVLGIATGLMFESWDNQTVAAVLPSLGLLLIALVLQISAAAVWLLKVAKWNRTDSLIAVYPGALAAVFDLLESEGASAKVIVVHLVRLLSITVLVSFYIPPSQAAPVVTAIAPAALGYLWPVCLLVGLCLLIGRLLLRIGVPAPFMLTAIVVTGVFMKTGYLHGFQMPEWSIDSAALILGVLIGSKFSDITLRDLVRHGRTGVACVTLMLLIAAVFAEAAKLALGNDPVVTWLAYMPGAIETIAMVAFGGGLNVVFILCHHLVRLLILHFAPALLVQARRWRHSAERPPL